MKKGRNGPRSNANKKREQPQKKSIKKYQAPKKKQRKKPDYVSRPMLASK